MEEERKWGWGEEVDRKTSCSRNGCRYRGVLHFCFYGEFCVVLHLTLYDYHEHGASAYDNPPRITLVLP